MNFLRAVSFRPIFKLSGWVERIMRGGGGARVKSVTNHILVQAP